MDPLVTALDGLAKMVQGMADLARQRERSVSLERKMRRQRQHDDAALGRTVEGAGTPGYMNDVRTFAERCYGMPRAVPRAGTKDIPPVEMPFSPTFGPLETPTPNTDEIFEMAGARVRRPPLGALGAEVLADSMHGFSRRTGQPTPMTPPPVVAASTWQDGDPIGVDARMQAGLVEDARRRATAPTIATDEDLDAAREASVARAPQPLDCEEARRQRMEPTRAADCRANPLAWMRVAAYYGERLALGQFGERPVERAVEDLVRSIEALPGYADARLQAVFMLSAAQRAEYLQVWEECRADLARALAAQTIDLDHQTRILFKLGDVPTATQEELARMVEAGLLNEDADDDAPLTPVVPPTPLQTHEPARPPDMPPETF